MELAYKRILLKISGEVLAGGKGMGIDYDTVLNICSEVKECVDMGVEVGLVVGGGNFWRRTLERRYGQNQSRPYRYARHRHELPRPRRCA